MPFSIFRKFIKLQKCVDQTMCGITQFVEIVYRNTQIRSKYLEKIGHCINMITYSNQAENLITVV